jgi:septum formation protein
MKKIRIEPSETINNSMNPIRLVLASASPRRHELLSLLGVPFTVVATNAEESGESVPAPVLESLPPYPLTNDQHPTLLAWRKTHAVYEQDAADVILGADTIVVLDDIVLGKPRNATHACDMLGLLSGKTHRVYTGLCSCSTLTGQHKNQKPVWKYDLVATHVTFAPLSSDDIAAYVATGECFGKAGAYAAQGRGENLIRSVSGSFTSVVGLPLMATWKMLTEAGVFGLNDPTNAYTNWLGSQGKEPFPCPPTLP